VADDSSAFAKADESERDDRILFGLARGHSCDDLAKTERELAVCRRWEPGVREFVEQGVVISTDICRE
jgi:hypothetical protein